MAKAVEKEAVAAREGEEVVIGRARVVTHRVGPEKTTHHQRSKADRSDAGRLGVRLLELR